MKTLWEFPLTSANTMSRKIALGLEKWSRSSNLIGNFGIMSRFTEKGVLLGENKKITPEVVGRLIEDSY